MESLYDFLSFSDMKNLIELLALYIEVNQKVIDEGKNTSDIFVRFTKILADIADVLRRLSLEIVSKDVS